MKPHSGESKEDFKKRQKEEDQLNLEELGLSENQDDLSKRTIVEGIMMPRMKEMFSLIAKELQKHNLMPLVPAGLVLAGGGAETVGIVEVAKRTLNLPARVGRPIELKGLIDDIQKPSFTASIGLLVYASRRNVAQPPQKIVRISDMMNGIKVDQISNKIVQLIKSIIP